MHQIYSFIQIQVKKEKTVLNESDSISDEEKWDLVNTIRKYQNLMKMKINN